MVLSERQLPLHSWVMLPGLWQALLFLLLLRTWLGGNYPGIWVSLELKRCVQEHSWLLGKTCSSVMTSRTTHICSAFSSVVLVIFFSFQISLVGNIHVFKWQGKASRPIFITLGNSKILSLKKCIVSTGICLHIEKKQGILLSFSIYLFRKRKQCARGDNHSVHTLLFTWGLIYSDNELI